MARGKKKAVTVIALLIEQGAHRNLKGEVVHVEYRGTDFSIAVEIAGHLGRTSGHPAWSAVPQPGGGFHIRRARVPRERPKRRRTGSK